MYHNCVSQLEIWVTDAATLSFLAERSDRIPTDRGILRNMQATPFVPGRVHGRVNRRDIGGAENILLLSQSELTSFAISRPAGFIIVEGAFLSHPMIRLLGLGIPTVIVTVEQAAELLDGAEIILDGARGVILPFDEDLTSTSEIPPPAPMAGQPVMTADGIAVELRASVADSEGVAKAVVQGATAIGLVRSEFIMPVDGTLPDVDFYQTGFSELCDCAGSLPVTIRLLDIAGDKCPPWMDRQPGMEGPLGLQGARLYGMEPVREVYRAQVRAIGSLIGQYELRLLLPYIISIHEFMRWRQEIEQILPISLPIGTMVETPAAALEMARWFRYADFVSLGCNDLMQCVFAADRDHAELKSYLDPYSPVLFCFLGQIAEASGENIDKVQVCGLLPQVPGVMAVLLGLGYRAFSIEPIFIPYLAQTIARSTMTENCKLAAEVCANTDSESVQRMLLANNFQFGIGKVNLKSSVDRYDVKLGL